MKDITKTFKKLVLEEGQVFDLFNEPVIILQVGENIIAGNQEFTAMSLTGEYYVGYHNIHDERTRVVKSLNLFKVLGELQDLKGSDWDIDK